MVEILEQRLVDASRGDREAAAAVYDDVADAVYGLALQMTGDPEQAELIARDALLAVLRTAALFDPAQGSARSWIVGVVHRHATRSRRSTQHARRHVPAVPAPVAGLATLSGPDASAVGLAYFGACTYDEVARDTEESPAQALTRLRSALLDLGGALTAAAEPGRST